jgi:hypothetical protein
MGINQSQLSSINSPMLNYQRVWLVAPVPTDFPTGAMGPDPQSSRWQLATPRLG